MFNNRKSSGEAYGSCMRRPMSYLLCWIVCISTFLGSYWSDACFMTVTGQVGNISEHPVISSHSSDIYSGNLPLLSCTTCSNHWRRDMVRQGEGKKTQSYINIPRTLLGQVALKRNRAYSGSLLTKRVCLTSYIFEASLTNHTETLARHRSVSKSSSSTHSPLVRSHLHLKIHNGGASVWPAIELIANAWSKVSPWMCHGNVNDFLVCHPNENKILLLLQVSDGEWCVFKEEPVFMKILSALEYLHEHSMVHGNIRGVSVTDVALHVRWSPDLLVNRAACSYPSTNRLR